MKKIYFTAILFFFALPIFSQQILRIVENSSSFYFSEAEVIDDSLLIYYMDSLDHQYFHTAKNFKIAKLSNNNRSIQCALSVKRPDFMNLHYVSVQLDSTTYFKVGNEFTDITTARPRPHLWYNISGLTGFDSLKNYQFPDTTYQFFSVGKAFLINGTAYVFGGTSRSDYPYTELLMIKHNLASSTYRIATYEMPTAFDLVNDVIYDNTANEFIISTSSQLGSGQIPFGAAVCKIDTNMVLDSNTVKTLEVNYQSYLLVTPNPYTFSTATKKIDSNKMLIIGFIPNQSTLNIPNNKGGRDVAVGLRGLDSLNEIGPSNIVGKRDTSDNLLIGDLKLSRLNSNRYLTVLSSRFVDPEPEPWNTTASVYGIDAQANKMWEYHLDMQDYCWVRDFYPSNDGGLWIINQCSENLDPINGTYDYFIKVAYLDSTVFWPGVLTDVVEPERKASELKIYPNPVSEQLNIEQYGQIVPLEGLLFNMGGKLLKRIPIKSHQNQLEISQLHPANYILKIIDAEGREVKTEKIVVME